MSLLERMRGNAEGDVLKAALLAPAVMTAAADGAQDGKEADQLAMIFQFSPVFAGDGAADFRRVIGTIMEAWRGVGTGAILAEVKAILPPPLRETAIAFAMRVAIADGTVAPSEADAVVAMAQALDVPEATYDKMAEVVLILHRGPSA